MNCLISDAPAWRAINTILDDITEPAEVIVLTSDIAATDLARYVLTHTAARYCQVTVIAERSPSVDPAVELIGRENYNFAWLTYALDPYRPSRFRGNVVLVNAHGRVSAAIGSAPLNGNRWASEREIWTVLRHRCGCSPVALHELADMICLLALSDTHCDLDPRAGFALYNAARDIDATEAVDTEARFLSNHYRPLVDQLHDLITGPVDDLAIYSPAYDAQLSGVGTLVDIFQPTRTGTLYATRRPRASRKTIVERMSADSQRRNVHLPATWTGATSADATVIQWRTAGQTFTLTGLSAIDDRTLCLPAHYTQARFEIAVLSQADTPLVPWSSAHIDEHWKARVLPLPTLNTTCLS